jgi:hypothetical protein
MLLNLPQRPEENQQTELMTFSFNVEGLVRSGS